VFERLVKDKEGVKKRSNSAIFQNPSFATDQDHQAFITKWLINQ
jgi:hypothetical protein